jgi:hypothetical protein
MNQPRYRKSTPPDTLAFNSPEEREKFIQESMEAGRQAFGMLVSKLPEFKTTSELTKGQGEIIRVLVDKCTMYCPHIDTLVMPKVKHFILPEIKTIFCYTCADDFFKLATNKNSNDCDLCEKKNKYFVEFSVPLGRGILTFNLGTKCCASKINGEVYED